MQASTLQLKPDQVVPTQAVCEWLKGEGDSLKALIAFPGFGKTITACYALAQGGSNHRVMIMVNQGELVGQWFDSLLLCGVPRSEIGVIWEQTPPQRPNGCVPFPKGNYRQRIHICMAQTLLTRIKKGNSFPANLVPPYLIADEIDDLYGHQAYQHYRRLADRELVLTGTPTFHPDSKIKFTDVYPIDCWIQTTTAAQMFAEKRWKQLELLPLSSNFKARLVQEFEFVPLESRSFEYDTTSQRDVMLRCIPEIYAEWERQPGIHHLPTSWLCPDKKVATTIAALLREKGFVVAEIYGDSDPDTRRAEMEAFRQGKIPHLVAVDCFGRGVDAPIASVMILLRRWRRLGSFYQALGRILRKHEISDTAYLIDIGLNTAIHMPLAQCEWEDMSDAPKFYDPAATICQQCGKDHKSTVKPKHPFDLSERFLVRDRRFADGLPADENLPLTCHGCDAPVYVDRKALEIYAHWRIEANHAFSEGRSFAPFHGDTIGYSVGKPYPGVEEKLTVGLLYDVGIWKEGSPAEPNHDNLYRDRTAEVEESLYQQQQRLAADKLRLAKLLSLPDNLQQILNTYTWRLICQEKDPARGWRIGLLWCYYNDSAIRKLKSLPLDCATTQEEQTAYVSQALADLPEAGDLYRAWLARQPRDKDATVNEILLTARRYANTTEF